MNSAVPLIDASRAPLLARPYFEAEDPSPLVRVLAHVPELLDAAMPFMAAVYGPTALDERIKEIVILRVSARNGCRYCTRTHRDLALAARLSHAEVDALIGETSAPPSFCEREREAFAFADAMCERPAIAPSLLGPAYRDDHVVELALLASSTIFLNRFCTALGLA